MSNLYFGIVNSEIFTQNCFFISFFSFLTSALSITFLFLQENWRKVLSWKLFVLVLKKLLNQLFVWAVVNVYYLLVLGGIYFCLLLSFKPDSFLMAKSYLVDVETNECLENNGGCWQDKGANVTACKVLYYSENKHLREQTRFQFSIFMFINICEYFLRILSVGVYVNAPW